MELGEFKKLVNKEFGSNLQHATPGNVREFLDRVQSGLITPCEDGRIILQERASTHEEVMKDFFTKVLDLPKDDAIMLLWLLAFDLIFSAIEIQHEDTFRSLLGDLD